MPNLICIVSIVSAFIYSITSVISIELSWIFIFIVTSHCTVENFVEKLSKIQFFKCKTAFCYYITYVIYIPMNQTPDKILKYNSYLQKYRSQKSIKFSPPICLKTYSEKTQKYQDIAWRNNFWIHYALATYFFMTLILNSRSVISTTHRYHVST